MPHAILIYWLFADLSINTNFALSHYPSARFRVKILLLSNPVDFKPRNPLVWPPFATLSIFDYFLSVHQHVPTSSRYAVVLNPISKRYFKEVVQLVCCRTYFLSTRCCIADWSVCACLRIENLIKLVTPLATLASHPLHIYALFARPSFIDLHYTTPLLVFSYNSMPTSCCTYAHILLQLCPHPAALQPHNVLIWTLFAVRSISLLYVLMPYYLYHPCFQISQFYMQPSRHIYSLRLHTLEKPSKSSESFTFHPIIHYWNRPKGIAVTHSSRLFASES